MYVICSDLESVYVPEIWINLAAKTGIEELTTSPSNASSFIDCILIVKKKLF